MADPTITAVQCLEFEASQLTKRLIDDAARLEKDMRHFSRCLRERQEPLTPNGDAFTKLAEGLSQLRTLYAAVRTIKDCEVSGGK